MRSLRWSILATAVLVCGCRASPAKLTVWRNSVGPKDTPVIKDLGKRIKIRFEAESWEELVRKVRPDLAWNCRDMLWLGRDERGWPQFETARAYRYQPAGGPERWVLVELREGLYSREQEVFAGDCLRGVAKLREKVPVSDHGPGCYAVMILGRNSSCKVYEIGWPAESAGMGHWEIQRTLYILYDRDMRDHLGGTWRLVGEGPECSQGRTGIECHNSRIVSTSAEWTGRRSVRARIQLTTRSESIDGCVETGPDDARVFKQPKVVYRDFVLEGPSRAHSRLLGGHEYVIAGKGDTREKIVRHLASWTVGWAADRPGERDLILAAWRRALIRLNPRLPADPLPEGTKVYIVNSIHGDVEVLRRTRKSR